MGDLVHVLKTEEITRQSQIRMKRIRDADLVIIDDLMFMAINFVTDYNSISDTI